MFDQLLASFDIYAYKKPIVLEIFHFQEPCNLTRLKHNEMLPITFNGNPKEQYRVSLGICQKTFKIPTINLYTLFRITAD